MSILFQTIKAKRNPPADTKPSFANKTVLVTGANTGVGYEAALKFVQLGAERVILCVRSLKKGEDARARIQTAIGVQKDHDETTIDVWELDMLSYPSIQAFASRANKEIQRLDYAILNAGVVSASYAPSDYGWEKTLQVNTLSTTLLALLLLPQMRRAGDKATAFTPVLELVSSSNSYYYSSLIKDNGQGHLETYNEAKNFSAWTTYNISKVFLDFAKRGMVSLADTRGRENPPECAAPGPDVFVISVCPGPTKSELAREQTAWWVRIAVKLMAMFLQRSTEEGSRAYVSGVMQGLDGHGGFWQYDKLSEPAPLLLGDKDGKLQAKIWAEIVGALEKDVPEVRELVKG
ncbi:hypothetical protein B0A54_09875 [Friedmanniomyces endolithicus]|uniref:Uncharacterized protein n=1 Tax=Friedmanniomyces endolithicus TaxID=329885 RepID=A0A4U0UR75_9PEZI|nr:hypothetical protein LTS09_008077 [Friedmanniomyces endolithicus]TKA37872.1 hypothetical protein B0A54_09875 [Friedmanniomyces endolithicus]